MITLTSYTSLPDAFIVKGMLESNGIAVVLRDMNNPYVPTFGGVEVLVREEDYAQARQLLDAHQDA